MWPQSALCCQKEKQTSPGAKWNVLSSVGPPAGCSAIGVWSQMGGMLWEECGAQHSQVDNNGTTQRRRCRHWGADVCEVLIWKAASCCCCCCCCICRIYSQKLCGRLTVGLHTELDKHTCDVLACVFVLAHWYWFICTLAALNAALMHASPRTANGKWWQNSWTREVCLWRIVRTGNGQVDNKEEMSWSQLLSPWSTPLSSLCFYLQAALSVSLNSLFFSLFLTHWRMLTHQVPWLLSMGWCHFRWHHHAVCVCLHPPPTTTTTTTSPPEALPPLLSMEGRYCLTDSCYSLTISQPVL